MDFQHQIQAIFKESEFIFNTPHNHMDMNLSSTNTSITTNSILILFLPKGVNIDRQQRTSHEMNQTKNASDRNKSC